MYLARERYISAPRPGRGLTLTVVRPRSTQLVRFSPVLNGETGAPARPKRIDSHRPVTIATTVLGALCDELGWALGQLWFVDSQSDFPRCEAMWDAGTEQGSRESTHAAFELGARLAHQVWLARETRSRILVSPCGNDALPWRVQFGFSVTTVAGLFAVYAFLDQKDGDVDKVMLQSVARRARHTAFLLDRAVRQNVTSTDHRGYPLRRYGDFNRVDRRRRRDPADADRTASASSERAPAGANDLFAKLTRREKEVFLQLSEGRTNKEVASSLRISLNTAETHRARIMQKLELHSIGELVRFAIRYGIISL
jgi:DNA-binding CsgD family transcriptional regulator